MWYRMKPKNFRSWLRPIRVLSYVPVSGNWYKTVSKLYQSLHLNKVMEPLKNSDLVSKFAFYEYILFSNEMTGVRLEKGGGQ